MPATPYTLKSFGTPELWSPSGEVISWRSKGEQCLLAYLATYPGKRHDREFLADLLWNRSGLTQARTSLRQVLAGLRKSFGAALHEVLVAERDHILLKPDAIAVDAGELESLLAKGTVASLERACTLYRGDFLLGLGMRSEPFETWLRGERTRLQGLVERALVTLLGHYETGGELEHAIRVATRAGELNPFREATHRALMRLYAATGQLSLSLRQYEHCREILNGELGVDPDAETLALLDTIKASRITPLALRTRTPPPPADTVDASARPRGANGAARTGSAPASPRERRHITLLLCDLSGCLGHANLDVEELHAASSTLHGTCARIIRDLGGCVEPMAGRSLQAYFGYPRAQEQDAASAVHAALRIVAAFQHERLTGAGGPHIAVTSGEVLIDASEDGDAGPPGGIVGEPLHTAMELLKHAGADQVVISEHTRRLLPDIFLLEDTGMAMRLPPPAPPALWRVTGIRHDSGAPDMRHARPGAAVFVGREEEIALLARRWADARQGNGRIVLITGEPGLGKSRLTHTFHQSAMTGAAQYVWLRGSQHHQARTLHPVVCLLERLAGLSGRDDQGARLAKLRTWLAGHRVESDEILHALARLLAIPGGGGLAAMPASHERRQGKTFHALETLLMRVADQNPLMFVVEDLQWLDPATLELLERLLDQVETQRLLFILTSRSEAPLAHRLGDPSLTSIVLNRLERPQAEAMVRHLCAGKRLPGVVLDRIVGNADGIPLFLEELTRSVLESGALRELDDRYELKRAVTPDVAIPASLQASLQSRIDRLGPAKPIARIAAAIGRRFTLAQLTAVSGLEPDESRALMNHLIGADLVRARGRAPHITYTFKHVLIQEVAYAGMLRGDRRALHERIAKALEAEFPELRESEPELLAMHCLGAGLVEEALEHWHRAGDLAMRRSAVAEAIAHYTRALDTLALLPLNGIQAKREIALQSAVGRAWLRRGHASLEAERAYRRARALCESVGDRRTLFEVLLGLYQILISREQFEATAPVVEELSRLSEELDEPACRVEAGVARATLLLARGDFLQAEEEAEFALAAAETAPGDTLHFGQDGLVAAGALLARACCRQGRAEEANRHLDSALARAETLRHTPTLAFAHQQAAWHYQSIGDPQNTLAHAEMAATLAREQGAAWPLAVATCLKGWALGTTGQAGEGLDLMRQGIADLDELGIHLCRPHLLGMLAHVQMAADAQFPSR